MSLEERPLMGRSVKERDIDLVLTELVETSPSFRDWICNQIQPNIEIARFMSVCRSMDTSTGESDIEIALETSRGERYLLLIENKINAQLQDEQAQRYFDRGRSYVRRDVCDDYEVGLVAPDNYINQDIRNEFGRVISYESILDKLETLSHDAIPFVETLLEQAIEQQVAGYTARPEVTKSIQTRFGERADEFPEIKPYGQSDHLIRFHSTNPNHPDLVRYNIWVKGESDGREAMVRLSLDSDGPEHEINTLQNIIADHFGGMDGFELYGDTTMWTVRTIVDTERDNRVTNEEYINEIVSELGRLVAHYHPVLVKADPD